MRIGLVSLNQAWENKEKNFQSCSEIVEIAARQKVELVVFPEMTLTGFTMNISRIAEKEHDSESVERFIGLAKQFNIAIIFGTVLAECEKARNCCFFVSNNGAVLASYTKLHPFSFASEDKFFVKGNKLSCIDFAGFRIGLTICYDLRFPEIYSILARDCDLILNIANWPARRIDHWQTLLKARAIENQTFVAGVNRIGVDGNGLVYQESSSLYNANGDLLDSENFGALKIFHIDRQWSKTFKEGFMTFSDRRDDFYKGFY